MKHRALALPPVLVLLFLAGLGFQASDPLTFRVMSYNIHHGEGNDGKIDLEGIARLIKDQGADLVGLQEVDKGVARSARRDMPGELAGLTEMSAFFNSNLEHQGGEYGNAALSRFPIESKANTHFKRVGESEPRGLLQTVVTIRGQKIVFMTTHLDFRPADGERLQNVEEIFRVAETYSPLPVILCGDFNDTPGSRVHLRMKERFRDAWESAGQGDGFTFSSGQPRRRIDYVWFSKAADLEASRAWVVSSPASDHMPLLVEFKSR